MSLYNGHQAEEMAKQYLIAQGLEWVESNFRTKLGEIDLIMRDKTYLIFIEVRKRASPFFGGAIESITHQKRQKILKTASLFLQRYQHYSKNPIRFDVICIEGKQAQINWIVNAFSDG